MSQDAWTQANLAAKRAAFPLRAPRAQTLAFWPVSVLAAAVDGYHAAFFMSLEPMAKGTVSLAGMPLAPAASPRPEVAECR